MGTSRPMALAVLRLMTSSNSIGACTGSSAGFSPLRMRSTIARIAMLFNPATATYAEFWLNPFETAATSFAVEAIPSPVRDRSELQSVIAAQARQPNGGLIVMRDSSMDAYRVEITSLAARYRLPAVYPFRFFAEVGGLLSYGIDRAVNFRRAAASLSA